MPDAAAHGGVCPGYPITGITAIGMRAFAHCTALTEVEFPDTLKTIGANAFIGCESPTDLTLPENLEEIHQYAFSMTGLTSITIPKNLKLIGADQNNHKSVGDMFRLCTHLSEIKVNENNETFTSVDGVLFQIQASPTEEPEDSDDSNNPIQTTFENYDPVILRLYSATRTGHYTIPKEVAGKQVQTIDHYAFYASGLTSITVPEGVTAIHIGAFENAKSLVSISLPASATYLGEWLSKLQEPEKGVLRGRRGAVGQDCSDRRVWRGRRF